MNQLFRHFKGPIYRRLFPEVPHRDDETKMESIYQRVYPGEPRPWRGDPSIFTDDKVHNDGTRERRFMPLPDDHPPLIVMRAVALRLSFVTIRRRDLTNQEVDYLTMHGLPFGQGVAIDYSDGDTHPAFAAAGILTNYGLTQCVRAERWEEFAGDDDFTFDELLEGRLVLCLDADGRPVAARDSTYSDSDIDVTYYTLRGCERVMQITGVESASPMSVGTSFLRNLRVSFEIISNDKGDQRWEDEVIIYDSVSDHDQARLTSLLWKKGDKTNAWLVPQRR